MRRRDDVEGGLSFSSVIAAKREIVLREDHAGEINGFITEIVRDLSNSLDMNNAL